MKILRISTTFRRLHGDGLCRYSKKLNEKWEIDKITNLSDEAEKARDYLMKLPERMTRISERLVVPAEGQLFKWVQPALVK